MSFAPRFGPSLCTAWITKPRVAWTAALCLTALSAATFSVRAADRSFADVVRNVQPKMVKIFGAGGYRGLTAYCTGVLVSPEGHILTVYSPTLDSRELRVHLYDGTRYEAEVVATEPQLDVALIKIRTPAELKLNDLPYFDITAPIPDVQPGDWVLAFSNLFEIATGDEPVSVQHGVIAAIAPLAARRGVHEAPYKGTVFVLDAITNNPGSHGGIVTTRRGEWIGLIGKEVRNTLSETWINYAMPIKDLRRFVEEARRGVYKRMPAPEDTTKIVQPLAEHGIVFVPDVLDLTPPYVEGVLRGSPAEQAGLKPDDLIVFVRLPASPGSSDYEERVVPSIKSFRQLTASLEPGTRIQIIVRRQQQLLTFDLTLAPRPKGNPAPAKKDSSL